MALMTKAKKKTAGIPGMPRPVHQALQEDELSIINVMSISVLQEAAQVQDLSQAVAISLHGKNIVKIQALELCMNLRTLDLSFNHIKYLEGLAGLSKLKELKLYDNQICYLGGLTTLTSLHTLDISGNRFSTLQGLGGLRSLRVLRCAHNPALQTLEHLGRANNLEMLDCSYCGLPDLSSLSAAVSLTELVLDGNKLVSLKGLQRLDKLQELRVAHNMLSTLQGLRGCAANLDMLDVRGNRLTSLDGLADGLTELHELYAADNALTSLQGLSSKATALETLDVANNRLDWRRGSCERLVADLSALPDLSWVHLTGNVGLPPGYQVALLAGITSLDGVDELARPQLPSGADVWVNPAEAGADQEIVQLLTGGIEASQLLPTVDEIEAYKTAMNINTDMPVIGLQVPARPGTSNRPTSATRTSLASRGGTGARPPSAAGRPGSAAGRLRPGTASGAGGAVKDIMMHTPVPSTRTGGASRLMTPEQYTDAVAGFGDTMAAYSTNLRSALATMKAGLQMNMSDAAQQISTPEGVAARTLPAMPVMPAMPDDMIRDKVLVPQPTTTNRKPTTKAQQAAELAAKKEALRDHGAPAALELYARLYPAPLQHKQGAVRPTSAASERPSSAAVDRLVLDSKGLEEGQQGRGGGQAAVKAVMAVGPVRGDRDDEDDDRDEMICGSEEDEGGADGGEDDDDDDGGADEYLVRDDDDDDDVGGVNGSQGQQGHGEAQANGHETTSSQPQLAAASSVGSTGVGGEGSEAMMGSGLRPAGGVMPGGGLTWKGGAPGNRAAAATAAAAAPPRPLSASRGPAAAVSPAAAPKPVGAGGVGAVPLAAALGQRRTLKARLPGQKPQQGAGTEHI